MTKRCLDEGVLQAYLDGELSQERAAGVAAHLAACEACAEALAGAEQETSFFAAAFAPDESVSVPTEVLRSRINAAVARLESQTESARSDSRGRNFGGFFSSLAGLFSFTPRGAAAFASLLAVVALSLVYFSAQKSQQGPAQTNEGQEVAKVNPSTVPVPVASATPEIHDSIEQAPAPTPGRETKATAGTAHVRVNQRTRRAAGSNGGVKPAATPAPKAEELPGEREYQTAIASLEQTIKLGGDQSLRPAVRAEYERNLALLDSAISQTRQVAARNPKDETAVSFLLAAYQSKVELLSKVADQAQVAALGR